MYVHCRSSQKVDRLDPAVYVLSEAHLWTLPILLVPPALVLATTAVVDAHGDGLRVDASRVRQPELDDGVVVFEKVGCVVGVHELDEADPPAALVIPQADDLDAVGVEDLGVGRDAREAIQDVVLGGVVGQALDDDGGRGPARCVSAGGAGARVGPTVAVVGLLVVVGQGAVVVLSRVVVGAG